MKKTEGRKNRDTVHLKGGLRKLYILYSVCEDEEIENTQFC
jgi:hypothetical protein